MSNKKEEAQNPQEGPIHVIYNDIHQLKDLLVLINDQPGHRKVILEGVPKQSNVITFQKPNEPTSAETKSESKDSPANTAPNADASSSSETDQIHLNIENVNSVDDLLDRLDEAVQNVPVEIDLETSVEKTPGICLIRNNCQLSLSFV